MELASQSKSTNGTSNKKKKLSEAAPTYPSENIPGNDAVTLEDTNNKKNEPSEATTVFDTTYPSENIPGNDAVTAEDTNNKKNEPCKVTPVFDTTYPTENIPDNVAFDNVSDQLDKNNQAFEMEQNTNVTPSVIAQDEIQCNDVADLCNEIEPSVYRKPQQFPSVEDNASSSDNYDPEEDSDSSSSSCSTCSTSSSSSDSTTGTPQINQPGHSLKKTRNESMWKKNIRKNKRRRGKSYIGAKNITKAARPLLPSPCFEKPNHKCITFVKEENRREIYTQFRKLPSLDDQRVFVVNHVEQGFKSRVTRKIENSRRSFTYKYTLTVEGQKRKVCRDFFMATLNVTDSFIRTACQKRSDSGIIEGDLRGKHAPFNKLRDQDDKLIRDHIMSFPAVESHYCRSSTQKKYLDASLNISIMHRLYKTMCMEKNVKPVCLEKYRNVFSEYNLGFFRPKKDQCKQCLAQKNMTESEKIEHEHSFQQHLARKTQAREARDNDKQTAKENPEVLSFNFDLESVLTTPKGPAGQIFYLRKLAIYNLTIYNLANQDVDCYLWEETQGKRGAIEVASSIRDYLLAHPNIKEVRMMSDGCGGQQKNSIFGAMCLEVFSVHPSLVQIDHKFFETGHTEMECDSVHSKIEQKSKYVPVYSCEGWAQIIRSARVKPRPFVVKNLTHEDFLDFKTFGVQSFKLSQISWRKVFWIRYLKADQTKILYKFNYNDEFEVANITKSKGRPKKVQLNKAYRDELPINAAKFQDLQKMCSDLTIPKIYHPFYNSLKVSDKVRDRLPEPDVNEDPVNSDAEEDE